MPSSGHGLFHTRRSKTPPFSDGEEEAKRATEGQPFCLPLVQRGENLYSVARRFIREETDLVQENILTAYFRNETEATQIK